MAAPKRQCEQQSSLILGLQRNQQEKVLMRKEGDNEKRINPNLSFPSTARHVKFHQLHIFKLILQ